MQKYFSSSALVAAAIISASALSAHAESPKTGMYVRADAGITMPRDDSTQVLSTAGTAVAGKAKFDDAAVVGAGLGYRWNDYLRSDVTLSYRNMDAVVHGSSNWDSTFKNYTTMGTVYLDVAPVLNTKIEKFEPYVMAGLGWAHNEQEKTNVTGGALVGSVNGGTQDDLAWKIGAGSGYKLTDAITLDAAYQYVDLGQFKGSRQNSLTNSGTPVGTLLKASEVDLTSHEITVGVRYAF